MAVAVAVLDANVLYPAPLRDLLLQLSFAGLFRARWTTLINDEWTRNLLARRPELADRIDRTRAVMQRAIPDALVANYEPLVAMLSLPDPDDRHVLAAAISAEADVIVTFNLKDFPASTLAEYGIEALHPDVFLQSIIAASPGRFLSSARDCLSRLTHPPVEKREYLQVLRRLGLESTATFLDDRPGCSLSKRQPFV